MLKFARMCLNWKVLVTLGAAGVLIWVVAPNALLNALLLLLLAACPLSMLVMAWGMRRGMDYAHHTQPVQEGSPAAPEPEPSLKLAELQAKHAALEREIAQVRAQVERRGDVRQAVAEAKE